MIVSILLRLARCPLNCDSDFNVWRPQYWFDRIWNWYPFQCMCFVFLLQEWLIKTVWSNLCNISNTGLPCLILLLTTSILFSWSDTHHCLDNADMYLWCKDLDDTKQTENKWHVGGYSCQLESVFLTFSPFLFVLALSTFLLRPVLATLVSWFRMSPNEHISAVCRSSYVEIRRISSLRR